MVTKMIVIHMQFLLWTNCTQNSQLPDWCPVMTPVTFCWQNEAQSWLWAHEMKTFSADCLILTSSKHTRSLACIVSSGGYVIILYVWLFGISSFILFLIMTIFVCKIICNFQVNKEALYIFTYYHLITAFLHMLSSPSTSLVEIVSNNTKSGGICFPRVCLLSHIKWDSKSLVEHV